MANTITIGTVQTITSTTAGTIKTLAGTSVSYSDATLATREIDLVLGEYVVFAFDTPTTTNISPLASLYAQGLEYSNASNNLTAASILRLLQIYNCCAGKKGVEYLTKFDKMIPCDHLKDDAELMVGLIDSVVGFVPEDEYITGRQAVYSFTATTTGGVPVVTLTIGTAAYSFNSIGSSNDDFAADIAKNINLLHPINFPYFATSSGNNVIVSGTTFDTANATAISGSTTNGTLTFIAPNTLIGGVAATQQPANAITNEKMQSILNKLNDLCSTPCQDIVNFDSEILDGINYMYVESAKKPPFLVR